MSRFDRPRALWVAVAGVLALLYVPIAVVVLYSFNSERSLVRFGRPSLDWYSRLAHDGDVLGSLVYSLEIALASTAIATVLGTLIALGLQRAWRPAAVATDGMIVLRLVAPETATAVALLLLFTQTHVPLSTGTLLGAHVALTVAFVTVVVRARLATLHAEMEEAALDLGATPVQALRLVVLPVVAPAILAGALLSFVLSFDNFITSYFTTGLGTQPLPVRIYSMLRFGVTPEVNAIGVIMLVIVLAAVGLGWGALRLSSRRRALA